LSAGLVNCCCAIFCCSESPDLAVLSKVYLSSSYGGNEKRVERDWFIGSVGTPTAHCRTGPVFGLPLINPFSPQRLHFKVTANQRRWSHAFMTGGRTSKSAQSNQAGTRRRADTFSAGCGNSPVTPKDSMLLGRFCLTEQFFGGQRLVDLNLQGLHAGVRKGIRPVIYLVTAKVFVL